MVCISHYFLDIFYGLFWSISQNKLGRHKVYVAVVRHNISNWYMHVLLVALWVIRHCQWGSENTLQNGKLCMVRDEGAGRHNRIISQIHITMFRWQKAVSANDDSLIMIMITSLVYKATHCHTHTLASLNNTRVLKLDNNMRE